jgi:lipopolysaccharide export system permease protein
MYIDELAGKGLDLKIISELLFQFTLSFVPTALPLAILLASLMTFGNMGEFSELTALKSSGISLQRIMRPLIVLISFLVLVSFLFSNFILPYSNRQARSLLSDIRRKRPDINLQAGSFNNDIDGFSIKITSKDPFSNRLDGLIVYDHRDKKGNIAVICADSGYIKITPDETALIMTLYDGESFYEMEEENPGVDQKRYPSRKDTFKEQTIVLGLTGFDLERSGNEMFASTSWSLNMSQLAHFVDSLRGKYSEKQISWVEFAKSKIFVEPQGSKDKSEKSASIKSLTATRTFEAQGVYDSLSVSNKRIVLSRTIEQLKDANLVLTDNIESLKF